MHLGSPKTSYLAKTGSPAVVVSVETTSEDRRAQIPWFKRINWFFILGMALMFVLSTAIWLAVLAH
jgi:hypothetical protein